MASNNVDKTGTVITVTMESPSPIYQRGQSSRQGAMLSVPENSQATEDNGETPLLVASESTSPSLVRRVSTLMRSASRRLASVNVPLMGNGYTNVDDDLGNEMQEYGNVDLTTLAGFDFTEHRVNGSPPATPSPFDDQETAYESSRGAAAPNPPSFAEFRARRRKLLGRGLDGGIRLERASSTRNEQPSFSEQTLRRRQTIYAQNLASTKNKIVAVPENVDLSLLEGTQIARRETGQNLHDQPTNHGGSVESNPQSYFFPQNADVPDWKPFSISSLYIFSLTILALSLAGLQEYLCQWSDTMEKEDSGILAFDQVADVSVAQFFAWKYLPSMVTIIYAVLFSIMDFDIRRLEPYYQLSQPNGSTASASLNLDHLTTFQYLVPFNAIRLKQWAVAFSTFGNIVAAAAAPALQNPSFNFVPNPKCGDGQDCPENTKRYFVRIDPVWSRLLTASYVLVAIITVVLLILMRRKSGLLGDPKGIAGIASMATKSHILQDFKGLDLATHEQIHKQLAHRRFVLYQSSIWQGEWTTKAEPLPESDSRLKSPHPPMLRLWWAVPFIGYMVACLIFVPLITLTGLNVIPNKAPWAPILVATILKLIWSTFEADVRLMEPFYQLSKGNARPENSITLDYQSTVYGVMPFVAIFKGHYLVAQVGFCSVLLDMLSVMAGSFSVSADIKQSSLRLPNGSEKSYDDETSVSFWASLILSLFILTFVIFTAILVYIRRHHPFLPREPSTIAAVLAFIFASHMLDDFVDTEKMSSKKLENRLKAGGKLYGLGYYLGRDNQYHCAIDEGPMTSKYVHGKSFASARSGPLPAHDFYPI